jgi:hypothetical protein
VIINVSYDSSVNSAPSSFKTAVSAAVQYIQSIFLNPITINIDVGFGEVNGQALDSGALGESETFFNNYTYTQVHNALVQNAHSADQISAASSLPTTDPTNGGNYWMATAEAKALGLAGASAAIDGFVGFSSSAMFDYNDNNGVSPGTYDFNGTFLHELTEVMGRGLFVGSAGIGPNSYTPMDLFHYSSAGVRDFVGTQAGYFSPDGGNTRLDAFNINSNGDFGDWAASAGNDSFLAFSNSGVVNAATQADIRVMNVLGYNETSAPSVTPTVATTGNDFNGDALADLVLQNTSNNSVMIDLMNGASVTSSVTIANSGGLQVRATGDLNHDNKTDIVLQNGSGTPEIWFMNGTSVTSKATLPNPGTSWHIIATGDFNADGNTDILWQNNDGSPSIWEMNGTSVIGWEALPNPGPTWHVIGSGDFNADGKADILWQNNDGSPSIWEMNGGSVIGWGALPNPGPTWHAIKTSDFNGDGHSDILWQNNDGTPAVWFMNGTTIAQWGGSLPDAGSTWHLKGNGPNASEPAINDATPLQNNENPNLIVASGDPRAPQPTLFSGNESGGPQTHPTIGSSI